MFNRFEMKDFIILRTYSILCTFFGYGLLVTNRVFFREGKVYAFEAHEESVNYVRSSERKYKLYSIIQTKELILKRI